VIDASAQYQLAQAQASCMRPGLPDEPGMPIELNTLLDEFLKNERNLASEWISAHPPGENMRYIESFEELRKIGPGQNDSLFDFLETTASLSDMKWFLKQESAGEAGFGDLLALTQVRMPVRARLEMARNYWDEMGRGRVPGMHGVLLENTMNYLELTDVPLSEIVPESLALSNLMIGRATNRAFAYHSVGALGVIEMTAPARVAKVDAGLKRLGIPAEMRRYFSLHASLDVRHSRDWNREVIEPLAMQSVAIANAISEGAIMRLTAGARCFARYRSEFQVK